LECEENSPNYFFKCDIFVVFFLNGLSRQSASEDNKSVALCVIKYLWYFQGIFSPRQKISF